MRRTVTWWVWIFALGLLVGCSPTPDDPSRSENSGSPPSPASGVAEAPDTPTETRPRGGLSQLRFPDLGYSDTPQLPGSHYRVHDGERPQPRKIHAGDQPTLAGPGAAPSDATILFDGNGLHRWQGRGGDAGWRLERDYMEVNGSGDIQTRDEFGDLQLHLEFSTPEAVQGESQGRGNSGVFLMGRYEVQILDSWKNPTYPDGQAAALYGQRPPLVNPSLPPGQWQSYDIVFIAPRFSDAGAVVAPPRVTVFHNGVLVHHDAAFLGPTRHRTLPEATVHPPRGPIGLQDHGNPIRFRNIWLRELRDYDE